VRAEFVFAAQKAVRARREDILREAILERQVEWELFERERDAIEGEEKRRRVLPVAKDPAALFIAAPLSVIAALGFPSWISETQLLVPEPAAMVYGHAP
jgi:hypothetical protein